MAKTHALQAEPRQRTGSAALRQMRREGFIPSIVYGGGSENRNVKVRTKSFRDMLAHSASDNILVDLAMDEGGKQLAFLQDVQTDPLTGAILHADFLAVNDRTEITASLPVELIGDAAGVKMGGQLEQLLYNVDIKCFPKDLPETIQAAVDHLEVGDVLHVGEVNWPEGVRPTLADDVVIALVAKTRVAMSDEATGGEEVAVEEQPSES